ncbi:MAG: L,D-transpeptidase [Deltaproteobacteria bacterium]
MAILLALILVAGVDAGRAAPPTQLPAPVQLLAPLPRLDPFVPHVEDRAPLLWAADEPVFVVVDRSCRTLSLYRDGKWVRTWHDIVFGRSAGVKRHEGDRRTPQGLYQVVGKRPHARWARFLLLDYPNPSDVEAHGAARQAGTIENGVGGAIGIHGSDAPLLNRAHVDWTLGCISLLDAEVRALARDVPVGTPVWIRP